MPERRVAIFVSHADAGTLHLAGSAALAATAVGDRVDVYLFGPAVPALVVAHGADADEPGALLHQARTAGTCRLIACSASIVEQKVPLHDAERTLDAIVGWPTILEWSRGVADRFSF